MKKIFITLFVIILAGISFYYITSNSTNDAGKNAAFVAGTDDTKSGEQEKTAADNKASESVIGKSVEGRDITAYHFGTGEKEILFIGGIHGGYEWNSVLVANAFIEDLKANKVTLPEGLKVTVIPLLNPDGLAKVVKSTKFTQADVDTSQTAQVAGRFNANNVDLNRNFDCDWKASGTWQSKTVSGGKSPFSEPETASLKTYVEKNRPTAVVGWFSSAGGVYSSSCGGEISAETTALTNEFAKASGYSAHKDFDSYEITGDMSNWFAKNNIPAISVLITNHTDVEWDRNKQGVEAVLNYFSK